MIRPGPEHAMNWRAEFTVEGQLITVHAKHSVVRRMPRGHELVRIARGQGHRMVDHIDYAWVVAHGGRRPLCTLTQFDNGDYRAGGVAFPGLSILDAARAITLRLMPKPA